MIERHAILPRGNDTAPPDVSALNRQIFCASTRNDVSTRLGRLAAHSKNMQRRVPLLVSRFQIMLHYLLSI